MPLARVDARLDQPRGGDPGQLGVAVRRRPAEIEQDPERTRGARQVVHAAPVPVAGVEQERRQVPDVDHLGEVARVAGREHPAAGRDPARPVGEPVGRVVRAGDQPRPADQRPVAEHLADDALRQRLVGAVVVGVVRHAGLELGQRRVLELGLGGRLAGVDGHARDEHVPARPVAEGLGRAPGDRRVVAGHVDDRVERAAVERGQVFGAVADDRLHARVEVGVGLAAVEQRDRVAAAERGFDDGAARELGAAEDEDLHSPMLAHRRRRFARIPLQAARST